MRRGYGISNRQESRAIAAFLALPILIYAVFCFFPTLSTLVYSLLKWNGISDEIKFVGLKNYVDLFTTNSTFQISVINTLIYTVFVVVVQNSLALLIATLIYKESRINNIYRTLFYLPVVLSAVTIGFTWSFIYDPNIGVLNTVLRFLNLKNWTHVWLSEKYIAILAIALVHVWWGCGNAMILYIAGLQGVPEEILEAASIDGCGKWKRFWKVTLPTLKPTVVLVIVLSLIGSFKTFELVWTMTQGGSDKSSMVLALQAYKEAFAYSDVGTGSAVAVILLIVVGSFSLIQLRLTSDRDR